MELGDVFYNKQEYVETASGNKVSRQSTLCGSQNIVLNGRTILMSNCIFRGDLANIRMGRFCVVGSRTIIRPPFKKFSKGVAFFPVHIGDHVFVEEDCVIIAAQIGSYVHIGKNAVVGRRSILKDCCAIADNAILAPDTVVPPFAIMAGSPGNPYLFPFILIYNFNSIVFTIFVFDMPQFLLVLIQYIPFAAVGAVGLVCCLIMRKLQDAIVRKLRIQVHFEVGKRLGVFLATEKGKLVVSKVEEGLPAYGRIFVGDIVKRMNGKRVKDLEDLKERIKNIRVDCLLEMKVKRRTGTMRYLGEENEDLVERDMGCDYLLAQANASEDLVPTLGVRVSNLRGRMILSDVESGSLMEGQMRVLDRLLGINGCPVSSIDDIQKVMDGSGGILAIVLERPLTDFMKNLYSRACSPKLQRWAV